MKTIIALLASTLFMISVVSASPVKIDKSSRSNHPVQISDQINRMIGYPSQLLNGNDQSVVVSYELDAANIIHVKEVHTSNTALKEYVTKHLDGKKIKNAAVQTGENVVIIHFVASKEQQYFFQY